MMVSFYLLSLLFIIRIVYHHTVLPRNDSSRLAKKKILQWICSFKTLFSAVEKKILVIWASTCFSLYHRFLVVRFRKKEEKKLLHSLFCVIQMLTIFFLFVECLSFIYLFFLGLFTYTVFFGFFFSLQIPWFFFS